MADVYLFNTCDSMLGLTLNKRPAHDLSAADSKKYIPTSKSIKRNPAEGNPGVAEFGGTNSLTVHNKDGDVTYDYTVDGISYSKVMAKKDLQIYVFYDQLIMVKEGIPVVISPATSFASEGNGVESAVED